MVANNSRIVLAKMAREDTGMEYCEDKVIKITLHQNIFIINTKMRKPVVLLKGTILWD